MKVMMMIRICRGHCALPPPLRGRGGEVETSEARSQGKSEALTRRPPPPTPPRKGEGSRGAASAAETAPVVLGAYALAAARARVLFSSPRAVRLFNRTGGTLMAGAAIAVASK
jgi:hypothetical protein